MRDIIKLLFYAGLGVIAPFVLIMWVGMIWDIIPLLALIIIGGGILMGLIQRNIDKTAKEQGWDKMSEEELMKIVKGEK